jgi:predicted lipid carrier protein YhbT
VATKQQVEAKLRELIGRLDAADDRVKRNLAGAVPAPRVIQMDVPDLGVSFWTELADGELGELHQGAAPQADIRVTASSDHLIEMIEGSRNMFSSYLAGQIRVQASVSDMLALRKLL